MRSSRWRIGLVCVAVIVTADLVGPRPCGGAAVSTESSGPVSGNLRVDFGGDPVRVVAVSGIGMVQPPIEATTGNDRWKKFAPGKPSYSNVVFRIEVPQNAEGPKGLWDANFKVAIEGKEVRRDISVKVLLGPNDEHVQYTLFDAKPFAWRSLGMQNADKPERPVYEEVEFTVSRVERTGKPLGERATESRGWVRVKISPGGPGAINPRSISGMGVKLHRNESSTTGNDLFALNTIGLAEYTKITMQVDAASPGRNLWEWLKDSQEEEHGRRTLEIEFLDRSGQRAGGYTYPDSFITAWRVPTLYASESYQKHVYEGVEIVPGYLDSRDW